MNGEDVDISIAMPTYRHERFLGQAIDSVVQQQVNATFEVVVGVDRCEDRTLAIARGYEQRYPGVVRVLEHRSRIGGRRNLVETLRACKGRYIAILDGDDRMLQHKLQRQIDRLESEEDLAFVGHDLRVISEVGCPLQARFSGARAARSRIEDLVRSGPFMGAASLMYRAQCLDVNTFAETHHDTHGDWYLQILAARNGDLGYIPEVLGEYRRHGGGVTQTERTSEGVERVYRIQLGIIDKAKEYVSESAVRRGKSRLALEAAMKLVERGDDQIFRRLIQESWDHYPRFSARQIWAYLMRRKPGAIRAVQRARRGLRSQFGSSKGSSSKAEAGTKEWPNS